MKTKPTSGYTLVEALISMAILAVLMMGVYGVLGTGNTVVSRDTAMLEMEQQARNGLQRMIKELRQSSAMTVSGASNDIVTFTTPTAVNIKYYLRTVGSTTYLSREYPSGTFANVASSIAYLNFSSAGTLLTVKIRADKTIYGTTISFLLVENVRLRNE